MKEVRFDPPGRAHETREQPRNQEHEPGPAAQVADDAVSVGHPEMAELLRADDFHVHATRANMPRGVRNEAPSRVRRPARVGRRQHGNAHQLWTRNTA
jgi:hypothetical protein